MDVRHKFFDGDRCGRALALRVVPAVLALVLTGPLDATVRVHDPELNLTFSLPDGFASNHELLREKNVVQGYLLPAAEGQAFGLVVLVERLGGTIANTSLGPTLRTKDGRTLEVAKAPWRSFTLDVVTVPETINGADTVTLNVQIPLTPHAAQVKVLGERSREVELRTLVRSILASAEGPTNWLTEEESGRRLGEGIGKLTFFLALAGYGVYRLVKRFRG